MVEINPETQKTRQERLATVITIAASLFIHLFVLIGGIQFYRWVEEEEKKERLMVIRRIAETSPAPPRPIPTGPSQPKAPKDAAIKEQGEPPPDEGQTQRLDELPDSSGQELPEEMDEQSTETTVSVVTDLPAATFTIAGPTEFYGTGTFWTKKDAPVGKYTATFHPASGFKTPPIQTKALEEEGKIVFVGKYTRSIEIKVATNVAEATFQIRRPDGVNLPMNRPGTVFLENLPLGVYNITFHDVDGYRTPAPQSGTLAKGGRKLSFVGSYLPTESSQKKEKAVQPTGSVLDRRVQMIIKSYPPTSVEESFDYIRYPEIIIRRSNFQSGWCRVYLVISIDGSGSIAGVKVERPRQEEREQFETLINTVETAARRWQYEDTRAEVHVDVRFYVE